MLSKLKSAITSALYFSLLIISFYDGVERLPKYDEFKSKMREMPADVPPHQALQKHRQQIGRASCRERV